MFRVTVNDLQTWTWKTILSAIFSTSIMVLALQRTESTFEEIPVMSDFNLFGDSVWELVCMLFISDIRDARGRDPVARRQLADLIRDACINVRLRLRSSYLIIPLSTVNLGWIFLWWSLRFSLIHSFWDLYGVTDVSWGILKCLVHSHGIPEEVIDNAVKAAMRYFSLPEAAKMEVSVYVSDWIAFTSSVSDSWISTNPPILKATQLSSAKIPIPQGLGTFTKRLI